MRLDLLASPREGAQDPGWDPGEVGDPVSDRSPFDAEATRQLSAELGLVEVADRLGPGIQGPGVERGPAAVGRRVHDVGDHHVGMEMRIASAGCPVPERGGDEAVGFDPLGAGLAAPGPGGHGLEELDAAGDRGVVRVSHLVGGLRITQGVEERHRLGRAERGVEARNARSALAASERVTGLRVRAVQHVVEGVGVDDSGEAEPLGATADPLAGGLFGAGVVLLGASGDGVEVVLLLTGSKLAEAQHGWDLPVAAHRAARTPGASASVR